MRLKDKVAIITGGGSGLGKASGLLFAREGARVVVAQRTEASGEATAAAIRAGGGQAIFVRTDVTVAADVEGLVRVVVEAFGRIDILYNSAGMAQKWMPVEGLDESAWDQLFAANVKSVFLTAKYAVPVMKKARSGVIINTGSMAAVRPRAHRSAYTSAKGAVMAFTRALALELAPFNIRVNCINPLATDTPMLRQSVAEGGMTWEEYNRTVVATSSPLGRLATPDDIAHAALYLASDEAGMITGTCLNVDGGRSI